MVKRVGHALVVCAGVSLSVLGFVPACLADETASSQQVEASVEEPSSSAEESAGDTTTTAYRPLGDENAFDMLQQGLRHVCFSICDQDFCFEKQQTRKFVESYKNWRGKEKQEAKVVESSETIVRCGAPGCDFSKTFASDRRLSDDWSSTGGFSWRQMLKHFTNAHGWTITVIDLPSYNGDNSQRQFVHCIDTQGHDLAPAAN